jgi:hypothetical protein
MIFKKKAIQPCECKGVYHKPITYSDLLYQFEETHVFKEAQLYHICL